MNTIYQAYFGALLISDQNLQQHPTDKAAVIKYIRRRERRTRAEKNRTKSEASDDVFEKVLENFSNKNNSSWLVLLILFSKQQI